MELDVIMPRLGLTMEEGTLVRWLKKAGEPVKAGEVIFEVETDKSIQEVESPRDGYLLEILVEEGSIVPVATPVARLSSPPVIASALREGISPSPAAPDSSFTPLPGAKPGNSSSEPLPAQPPSSPGPERSRPFVSWRARRLARESGIDLGALGPGSGPQGRIIERDIQRAIGWKDLSEPDEWIELTHLQRVTSERMQQSFSSVPHFYLSVEVNAESLLKLRQEQLALVQQAYAVRLTLSDILVKIAAQALMKHPRANASWMDGKLRLNRAIHIGLATAVPHGLLVPVIHHADRKSMGEIAQVRERLTHQAQHGKLAPDELSGGSFTLTNLGMYGIDQFQAIINPPQSVILAVGRIKERPWAENGQLVLKPVFFITLSCDHRVLDGVSGAAFLADLVKLVEAPDSPA
jgi:pyruvate dehydrogenase E2 component (dihydrolipoamide acetyltransferase)